MSQKEMEIIGELAINFAEDPRQLTIPIVHDTKKNIIYLQMGINKEDYYPLADEQIETLRTGGTIEAIIGKNQRIFADPLTICWPANLPLLEKDEPALSADDEIRDGLIPIH